VRVALLTEGGFPYAHGESVAWCDRLVRGVLASGAAVRFEVFSFSRGPRQAAGPRRALPPGVRWARTAPLWGPPPRGAVAPGLARRYADRFAELAAALCARSPEADRFATGLYGLARLAAEHGGLSRWLASERAVPVLAAACGAPGAPRAVRGAEPAALREAAGRLERVLRPLTLDWYGPAGQGLAGAAVCHAVGGGPAALAGLLARSVHGVPLLVTAAGPAPAAFGGGGAHAVPPSAPGAPVRALLTAFRAALAGEVARVAVPAAPGGRAPGPRGAAPPAGPEPCPAAFGALYAELGARPGGDLRRPAGIPAA
jgi:hypothetical protein